ncbi:MAG: carboxypeptidase M32, partial [Shimia sp.]|nr:carboxypeptidase M32 [Shimia sp.]
MSAYERLMGFTHTTQALGEVAGRLGWDQEAIMPVGAAPQRSEEMAAMESVLHARRIDPKVGEWLAAIDEAQLDEVGRAQVRHIRKSFERTSKVPADLA